MLEQLEFPKHLKDIPIIAGTHHEKLDGTGYPRGLKADEIPLEGKVLAIADVFEALTAKDRPYKKGKSLCESMRILGFMVKDGHLDPELFQFFVDNKLYLKYALKYLDGHQIDDVDINNLPGYVPISEREQVEDNVIKLPTLPPEADEKKKKKKAA